MVEGGTEMSVTTEYISPEYGLALNEKEFVEFLRKLNSIHKRDILIYDENVDLTVLDDNQALKKLTNRLIDSSLVYYEVQFNLYESRDAVYFTKYSTLKKEELDVIREDSQEFCGFIPVKNKINYRKFLIGYSSVDEAVNELIQEYGYALPNDFDYWEHFGYIEGTYYS